LLDADAALGWLVVLHTIQCVGHVRLSLTICRAMGNIEQEAPGCTPRQQGALAAVTSVRRVPARSADADCAA
jgi:hypothetical protein